MHILLRGNKFNIISKFLIDLFWHNQKNKIKLYLILLFAILVITIISNLTLPIIFKYIIDENSTILFFAIYGSFWAITQILSQLREFIMVPVIESAIMNMEGDLFTHLMKMPFSYHAEKKIGNLVDVFEKAQNSLPYFAHGFFFHIIPNVVKIITSVILVAKYLNIKYALVIFFTITISILLNYLGVVWQSKAQRAKNIADLEASAKFVDRISNFETLITASNIETETNKFNNVLLKRKKLRIISSARLYLVNIIQSIILGGAFIYLMISSGNLMLAGKITKGEFVMLHSYFVNIALPLRLIGYILLQVKQSLTDLELIISLFNIPPAKNNIKKIDHINEIEFINVNFRHLKNINFKLKRGESLVIKGPSGSGKTTIIRLLLGLYTPDSGEILINNINLNELELSNFRKHTATVLQDSELFNENLESNLFSKNLRKINEIMRIVNLKDSNQQVGQKGMKLSGGERKRVNIARALLRDADLIIFDEPAAGLDLALAQQIFNKIETSLQAKIKIIISHDYAFKSDYEITLN